MRALSRTMAAALGAIAALLLIIVLMSGLAMQAELWRPGVAVIFHDAPSEGRFLNFISRLHSGAAPMAVGFAAAWAFTFAATRVADWRVVFLSIAALCIVVTALVSELFLFSLRQVAASGWNWRAVTPLTPQRPFDTPSGSSFFLSDDAAAGSICAFANAPESCPSELMDIIIRALAIDPFATWALAAMLALSVVALLARAVKPWRFGVVWMLAAAAVSLAFAVTGGLISHLNPSVASDGYFSVAIAHGALSAPLLFGGLALWLSRPEAAAHPARATRFDAVASIALGFAFIAGRGAEILLGQAGMPNGAFDYPDKYESLFKTVSVMNIAVVCGVAVLATRRLINRGHAAKPPETLPHAP